MNRPEWMLPPEKSRLLFDNEFSGILQYEAFKAGFTFAQRKLLEYLHPQMEYMSPQRKLIESMLKQLETK
jgi:hypothetical protein